MLPIAILLAAWKVVVKTFSSVFDVLDEPLHQILHCSTIYLVLHPQPSACQTVPQSTICKYWFSAEPSLQLLEEMVANKDGPLFREVHHQAFVIVRFIGNP